MGFSKEWEETYQRGGQAIRWPWSDVVSLVIRYIPIKEPGFRVLELGCGSGANIPFFKAMGCEYYTVEGSPTVINQVLNVHPDLKGRALLADFTEEIPVTGYFDLIVDRASLTNNSTKAIKKSLSLVNSRLRVGGKYVGVDWFALDHPEYERGLPGEDPNTKTGYEDGVFAGLGTIHFSDEAHLHELFSCFQFLVLEHKLVQRAIPDDGFRIATWNFVCEKCK